MQNLIDIFIHYSWVGLSVFLITFVISKKNIGCSVLVTLTAAIGLIFMHQVIGSPEIPSKILMQLDGVLDSTVMILGIVSGSTGAFYATKIVRR